jgi:hypothetical protein
LTHLTPLTFIVLLSQKIIARINSLTKGLDKKYVDVAKIGETEPQPPEESPPCDDTIDNVHALTLKSFPHLFPPREAQKVIQGVYPGVHTSELDNLAAETSAYMSTTHPDYQRLAARISVSNLHKETSSSFSKTLKILATAIDPKTEEKAGFISKEMEELVDKFADVIDVKIQHSRDYNMNYFGFKTLEKVSV